jgi:transposase-like protein
MNPHQQFCHNLRCRAYGCCGEDHIVIYSHKERRYRCKRCGRTFTETKDTAFYRMHKPRWPAKLPRWRGRKPRWLLEAERAA